VRKLSAALFVFVFLTGAARADWEIAGATTETSTASVQHRHVVLQNNATGAEAIVDLALFDSAKCTLRVIDNPSGNEALADVMRGKFVAGVNGGFFDPSFAPIGLRVIDGKTIASLVHGRLLTGVLSASSREIEIVRLGEFSKKRPLVAAIECGPFLVDLGSKVRGLDDTREARRTFAAIARGGRAALGLCSEISLAQLSALLAEASLANDFKIVRAMNLDGGSSSAFWFKRNHGDAFSISEQKSVRDFVAIAPK
jgi:hypothetical protein